MPEALNNFISRSKMISLLQLMIILSKLVHIAGQTSIGFERQKNMTGKRNHDEV